jgi:hypothetical protein
MLGNGKTAGKVNVDINGDKRFFRNTINVDGFNERNEESIFYKHPHSMIQ